MTVEVIVVVVGIFLVMQATNWDDDRQVPTREQQHLEALKPDMTQVQSAIGAAKTQHRFLMDNGLVLIQYLRGEVAFDEHSAEIKH